MKTFIFTILLLLGTAQAGDRVSALRIICMPMNARPEFYACLQSFVKYYYFEDSALAICATMESNTDKIFCMESVGDAAYDKDETDLCASKVLDTEKQDCLDGHGRAYP